MHVSTNFGEEIREKKSPGTNGLTEFYFKALHQKIWLSSLLNMLKFPTTSGLSHLIWHRNSSEALHKNPTCHGLDGVQRYMSGFWTYISGLEKPDIYRCNGICLAFEHISGLEKPDIYRCICFNWDRLGFHAELQKLLAQCGSQSLLHLTKDFTATTPQCPHHCLFYPLQIL